MIQVKDIVLEPQTEDFKNMYAFFIMLDRDDNLNASQIHCD